MNMRKLVFALAICSAVGVITPAIAEKPVAEKVELKDGSTLYLHPDGTSRMIDQHGKPITMADGIEMEAKDGRVIIMQNKRIWVRYGPPGREIVIQKVD